MHYQQIKVKGYDLFIGTPVTINGVPNYTRNQWQAGCITEAELPEVLKLLPLKPEILELVPLPR